MPPNLPLITTVIPTYKRPKLLKRAIKSVLNQTYQNFQLVVFDNASEDETEDVVKKFSENDQRIKYWRHSKNIGPWKNYQFAIQQVKTSFFSILADDDLLLPQFYEITLKGFENYPGAYFSAGVSLVATEEREIYECNKYWSKDGYFKPETGLLKLIGHDQPIWNSILFRKEAIEQIGALDQEVGAPLDLDFKLRVAANFPFVITNTPCAVWVIHRNSHSIEYANLEYYWPGWLKMIQNINNSPISKELKSEAEKLLLFRLKKFLLNAVVQYLSRGDYLEVLKITTVLKNNNLTSPFISNFLNYFSRLSYSSEICNSFLKFKQFVHLIKHRGKSRKYNDYKELLNNY